MSRKRTIESLWWAFNADALVSDLAAFADSFTVEISDDSGTLLRAPCPTIPLAAIASRHISGITGFVLEVSGTTVRLIERGLEFHDGTAINPQARDPFYVDGELRIALLSRSSAGNDLNHYVEFVRRWTPPGIREE